MTTKTCSNMEDSFILEPITLKQTFLETEATEGTEANTAVQETRGFDMPHVRLHQSNCCLLALW